jgi:hypothetical protein
MTTRNLKRRSILQQVMLPSERKRRASLASAHSNCFLLFSSSVIMLHSLSWTPLPLSAHRLQQAQVTQLSIPQAAYPLPVTPATEVATYGHFNHAAHVTKTTQEEIRREPTKNDLVPIVAMASPETH